MLEAIDLDSIRSRGYAFQVEMTYRTIQQGFEVAEVPIVFRERREGSSKMDRRRNRGSMAGACDAPSL